jgi:hypothetical protein
LDNAADLTTGLGLFKAAIYLLLFAVLVVTGHGLWRCSRERDSRKDEPK